MTEASIGKKETNELAVMVATFFPLPLTKQAVALEKTEYMASWLESSGE
jgi:homogentisate 1,2-dioxygenase